MLDSQRFYEDRYYIFNTVTSVLFHLIIFPFLNKGTKFLSPRLKSKSQSIQPRTTLGT